MSVETQVPFWHKGFSLIYIHIWKLIRHLTLFSPLKATTSWIFTFPESFCRYNSNGFDLNRNFPEVQATNPAPDPVQKETQLVMDWLNNNTFVLSANLHGGEEVANYPLDHNYTGNAAFTPSTICYECHD